MADFSALFSTLQSATGFQIALTVILGMMLGSFSTALAWRAPREQSWAKGRSACPSCQASLTPLDLVPVFSWLLLKGRCRHCAAAISPRYPLTELTVVLACLGVFMTWGLSLPGLVIMIMLPFLVALLVIDAQYFILPDRLTAICAALAVLFLTIRVINGTITAPMAVLGYGGAGAVYALLVWGLGAIISTLKKKAALGFGDVKFFAVAGLWLGFSFFPYFLILAGGLGAVMGIVWRFRSDKDTFPFGPALIVSLYFCLVIMGLDQPVFTLFSPS